MNSTLPTTRRCAVVLIPVLRRKKARGWPEYDVGARAWYLPLARAFMTAYSTDAHFAAYSVPSVRRRLATVFVFRELPGGVPMVLFVIDVEPSGHAPVTPEWWQIELGKIERMLADHPGGFIYRTRGGYRIVYVLREPVVLASIDDAARWTATYLAWLQYVEDRYGIVGDRSCTDWTRLYRLPRVIRDGERQELLMIGDVAEIGEWAVEVTVPDAQAPQPRAPTQRYASTHPGQFDVDVFMAATYPGVTSRAVLGGRRWVVECPWQHEHSSKSERETTVFAGDDGRLGFHCFHNHCADRKWKDFRKWHQPDYVRQDTPATPTEHRPQGAGSERVSDVALLVRLHRLRNPASKSLIGKLLAGEPYARLEQWDTEMHRAAAVIAALAPNEDPEHLAKLLFEESLETMSKLPGADPADRYVETHLALAATKIARAQQRFRGGTR